MTRIDELDGTRKAAFTQIGEHRMTERTRTRTGADKSDAGRFEQAIEAADGHRGESFEISLTLAQQNVMVFALQQSHRHSPSLRGAKRRGNP
jgi:hypothetical protein